MCPMICVYPASFAWVSGNVIDERRTLTREEYRTFSTLLLKQSQRLRSFGKNPQTGSLRIRGSLHSMRTIFLAELVQDVSKSFNSTPVANIDSLLKSSFTDDSSICGG